MIREALYENQHQQGHSMNINPCTFRLSKIPQPQRLSRVHGANEAAISGTDLRTSSWGVAALHSWLSTVARRRGRVSVHALLRATWRSRQAMQAAGLRRMLLPHPLH